MNLFAYGTLLEPEIWRAVTGRNCRSEPAFLRGYEIRRVRDEDFPGIFPAGDSGQVPGRVFFDLDEELIRRLDAYEDDFYQRVAVTAFGLSGQPTPAQAYVVPEEHRALLSDEDWTYDWFRQEAMTAYMARHFGGPTPSDRNG